MEHWCSSVALLSCLAAVAWGCGGSLQGQGTFTSPNYPAAYPASQSCSWIITADSGKLVQLQFSAFDLETGTACSYDQVLVYNGPSTASTLVGSYCGATLPPAFIGGNVITVVFKSDASIQKTGFSANFQSVDSSAAPTTAKPSGACGGTYVSSTGSLSSPNYPNLYPNSASCVYTITVPNSKVVLSFSAVDLEASSTCSYDYLEVRDGSATGNLMAKVCGNSLPGKIVATGSTLYLKFVSDSSVQKTGFLASWEELTCQTKGGACVSSNACEGKVDGTLPCSGGGDVCCFPKIQQGACGTVPKSQIVGGNEADPYSWVWQASLQQTSNNFHFCGATVITPLWVVTAAHCVDGSTAASMQVVVGEHHLKETNQEQVFRVQSYIKHEGYNGNANGFPNDIALLKLATPIEFGRYVQPACLPELEEEFTDADNCWITGWGYTKGTGDDNVLNELKVGVLTRPDCRNKWGASYINEGHICVGNGLKGACNGDSGGPLVCERIQDGYSRWVLAGATSWGRSGCQTEGYPSVYTRISYFLPWIESKIRESLYKSD